MISRPPSEAVVLLHGLGANRFVMTRLATYLDAQGYRVANWGYRSIRDSIESHAQVFQKRISDFALPSSVRSLARGNTQHGRNCCSAGIQHRSSRKSWAVRDAWASKLWITHRTPAGRIARPILPALA